MMGLDQQKLLPEGVQAANAPAWAMQAGAATTSAAQARDEAKKAAEAALDAYKGAAEALNQLWVVHTQMGAVHHFLSLVAATPAEAQKQRDEARREYDSSIRGRSDRPEAQVYRRIIDSLSAAAQK
jgi:hypothetical protein